MFQDVFTPLAPGVALWCLQATSRLTAVESEAGVKLRPFEAEDQNSDFVDKVKNSRKNHEEPKRA